MQYSYEQAIEAGKKAVAAGDIQSANEIASWIDKNYPESLEPSPEPNEPITDRLLGVYEQGVSEASDRMSAIDENIDYGPVDYALGRPISDKAGVVASEGVQAVGGAGVEITKELWNSLPQYVRDPATDVFKFFSESPYAQSALTFINRGYDAYMEWAKENPYEAEKVEQVVDVTAMMTPRGKIPLSTKVEAGKNKLQEQVDDVQSKLEPDVNTGDGRWRETDGPSREAYYEPTAGEIEMYERVEMDVPKFDPSRTNRKNAEYVLDEVDAARDKLDKDIVKYGNPQVNTVDLLEELDEKIAGMPESQAGIKIAGNDKAAAVAERLLAEGRRLIMESDGTALGILNARREFDNIVQRTLGDGTYDTDRISGANVATKIIRDQMNEAVEFAVPDANVHDLLDKQHQLIKAHDILNARAQRELNNTWQRSLDRLKKLDIVPSTILGLMATTGIAANAVVGSPALASIALTAGGLYMGGKLYNIATSKKVIGQTIQSLDKAMKMTQNASDKAALRADRAMLVEYLRSLPEEDESGVDSQ